MKVLVIAEHDNQALKDNSLSAITAGLELGRVSDSSDSSIDVLVAGAACNSVAQQAALVPGISKVLLAEDDAFTHFLPEAVAPAIKALCEGYTHVLTPASTVGKNLLPRLAALLDVAQLSEVTGIVSEDSFVRPIYAGNALATVKSSDSIKLLTIRASAFDKALVEGGSAEVEILSLSADNQLSRFVDQSLTKSERPELESARVVISGGRGFGSEEKFSLLNGLADKLGAAIGASRAAVDSGYVGNELQVGQTGKIVAPELYMAIGISGAIQHLAGMKDSKVIVAINKDAEAPIFQAADYGLVGDLFTIVPELEALL